MDQSGSRLETKRPAAAGAGQACCLNFAAGTGLAAPATQAALQSSWSSVRKPAASHTSPLPWPPSFSLPTEHQPPSWSSYFTDLHIASLLAPAGLLLCFRPLTDASMFLLLYGVTAVYFSGVMVSHDEGRRHSPCHGWLPQGCLGAAECICALKQLSCTRPRPVGSAMRLGHMQHRGRPRQGAVCCLACLLPIPPASHSHILPIPRRPAGNTTHPCPPHLPSPLAAGAPHAGAGPRGLLPGGPGPLRGHRLPVSLAGGSAAAGRR